MESSHHEQGDGLGGDVIENRQAVVPAQQTSAIAALVPELLGAIGDGLLVISTVSAPPVWHNDQGRKLLGLAISVVETTTWQDLVAHLWEQLIDQTQPDASTQIGPLLELPPDENSPSKGRLVFHRERAVDWTLRRLSSSEDRWLLVLRDATPLFASERSLQRSDSVLQNVVEEQQHLLHMIRQLGTPVLPIYSRIVVLPLVGHIDSGRAEHIMDAVLSAIVRYQAEVVIIDITGVSVVDTSVANSLLQTVRAADLIGTLSILVGISAEVARSMVHLGVDLHRVVTRRDLQAGIAYALRHTGHSIVRVREEIDWLASVAGDVRPTAIHSSIATSPMPEVNLAEHPSRTTPAGPL